MKRYYCDRCGKEAKIDELFCKDLHLLYYNVDLCENCYDKLVKMVNEFLKKEK